MHQGVQGPFAGDAHNLRAVLSPSMRTPKI